MTTKTTQRDYYAMLIKVVEASTASNKSELADFLNGRIEMLDRKRGTSPSANSARGKLQTENREYQKIILDILNKAGEPLTIGGIQAYADEPLKSFSTSKISALLKPLKDNGTIVRTEIKKKAYFGIANKEE